MKKISFLLGLIGLSASSLFICTFSARAQTDEIIQITPEPLSEDLVPFENTSNPAPVPGTVATSTELLFQSPENQSSANKSESELTQRDIFLGRKTRDNYSYIGVGINIGFGGSGDNTIGDTGFAITSKINLASSLSLRPGIIFTNQTAFLIPVTYDFSIPGAEPFEPSLLTPYIGGGVVFTTDDENEVGFLLTGGVDFRFLEDFVANAAINAGFGESTEAGLLLTLGYIFSGN